MCKEKEYEDKRILTLDGKNRKLDMSSKIEPSGNFYRPITEKSKVTLTVCDYTNKENGGSKTAKFNFTPEEIGEFNFIMEQIGDFTKSYDRIFNSPDEKGLSPVKRFLISRQAKMQDGTPSKYPIYIQIQNGRAKCNVNDKGMTSFSNNTFTCESKVDIRLSYEDARFLFRETANFIERIKLYYMIQNTNETNKEETEKFLTEQRYIDGVNALYKNLANKISEELQKIKDELAFK